MEKQNQITFASETIGKDLLNSLDESFADEPLQKMQSTFRRIEENLKEYLARYILEYVLNPLIDKNIQYLTKKFFLYRNLPTSLNISENPKIPTELVVALLCKRGSKPITKEYSLDIKGFGQFRRVCVIVDDRIAVNLDKVLTIVCVVYNTGYSWMLEYFRMLLLKAENELTNSLYSYIRKMLSGQFDEKLISQVWIATTSGQSHGYIFDRLFVEDKIKKLDHEKIIAGESAATLLSELLLAHLKYEQTLAQRAEKKKGLIKTDLRKAPYFELNDTLYEVAEEVFYSDQRIIVYPIVAEKPYRLFAYFPIENKDELIPVFDKHKDRIKEIFLNRARILKATKSKLRKIVSDDRSFKKIGEFCGGFFKAFIEP